MEEVIDLTRDSDTDIQEECCSIELLMESVVNSRENLTGTFKAEEICRGQNEQVNYNLLLVLELGYQFPGSIT